MEECLWRPIETAPRDGVEIIVGCWQAGVWLVRSAWYRDAAKLRQNGNSDVPDEDTGWWSYRNSTTQEQLDGIYTPTHWVPLPAMDG
jgi:hypothetical protein